MEMDLIYLDNAATAWPKPEPDYEFMMQFYRTTGVNPGRTGFDEAIEAGAILDNLRRVDHDIATRTGLHCAPRVHQPIGTLERKGGVRFSVGPFNSESDIEAAIGAVRSISEWKASRK